MKYYIGSTNGSGIEAETFDDFVQYLEDMAQYAEEQGDEYFEVNVENYISLDNDMLPDNCLHIEGYLKRNYDDICSVTDTLDEDYWNTTSIIGMIEGYAEDNGFLREKTKGLGGTQSIIRNCNLRIYFTDTKCTLCQAQRRLDALMYGGDLVTDVSKVGYSEYTITGLDLEEFTIGGHDLDMELGSHLGEYIHMIIECN